jgi:hypothetical protein
MYCGAIRQRSRAALGGFHRVGLVELESRVCRTTWSRPTEEVVQNAASERTPLRHDRQLGVVGLLFLAPKVKRMKSESAGQP